MTLKKGQTRLFGRDPKLIALGVLALLALMLAIAEFTNVINLFHNDSNGTVIESANKHAANSNVDTAGSTNSSKSDAQNSTTNSSQADSKLGGSSTATLKTPSGDFVSNHNPSKDDTEESVCVTTEGAMCYIKFVKGNQTKKLAADVTDSNGEIYWKWTPEEVGLSGGPWQIIAVATLNNKSKTAQDVIPLNVKP